MGLQKRGILLVVLAVFTLLASSLFVLADTAGCYLYPDASEDYYCVSGTLLSEAQQDCEEDVNCEDVNDYFVANAQCSQFEECTLVTCDVYCDFEATYQGQCEAQGGTVIEENEYDFYCSPGCCRIPENGDSQSCNFGWTRYECKDKAIKLGEEGDFLYDNSLSMTPQLCAESICNIEITKKTLVISVVDEAGIPLDGVTVVLKDQDQSGVTSSGNVTFLVNSGIYLVETSFPNYFAPTVPVEVGFENKTIAVIEMALFEGGIEVVGVAQDTQGNPLADATIAWQGESGADSSKTNAQGEFTTTLMPGEYVFTASKVGYMKDTKQVSISSQNSQLSFVLEAQKTQGIAGVAFIDHDNNKQLSDIDEAAYGASIYVDGIFKGYAQYPDGSFTIPLTAGNHSVKASYQEFLFEGSVIVGEEQVEYNLPLSSFVGECTEPGTEKPVEEFNVQHVFGKKQFQVEWKKPCLEIIGYDLVRISSEGNETVALSPAFKEYTDFEVEWGETYTYSIIAYYDKGRQTTSGTITITMGSQQCEDRAVDETFCLVEDQISDENARKQVWTCNAQNQLAVSKACGELDGAGDVYYCQNVASNVAECGNAGYCSFGAQPFELYHSRDQCYQFSGESTPTTFCYYDSTSTIVDQCSSCINIESCFEYQSKDACEINSCLSEQCKWINAAEEGDSPLVDYASLNIDVPGLVTQETGRGYCVPEKPYEGTTIDTEGDDYCSLCNSEATLFENYYCTANVCSNLGRCFSTKSLTECSSCGEYPTKEANCYTYESELECTGGQAAMVDPFGVKTPSQDQCGWNTCVWDPSGVGSGVCYKDGNGDTDDDCEEFTSGGERQACEMDNSAPLTTLLQDGVKTISLASPNVTFLGDDSYHQSPTQRNKMGILRYCISSASGDSQVICDKDHQTVVEYPGSQQVETVTVDILTALEGEKTDAWGETYQILFHSEDKYKNREALKKAYVFVDNVKPDFTINHEVSTVGDTTDLTVYLEGINELMSCSFSMDQIVPKGTNATVKQVGKHDNKTVEFPQLSGVQYNISVECVDEAGNMEIKSEPLLFDLEERIDILSPQVGGTLAITEIIFEIETIAGASCALYETVTNELVAEFITDESGKSHKTKPIAGFIEKEYVGEYKAVCQELLTQEMYEDDFFHFTVDFTGPSTQIHLQEGSRIEEPTEYGFEIPFIEAVDVSFSCNADGFPCDVTYYCLGEFCDFIDDPKYQEFTGEVTVTNTTQICYYSVDEAGNKPPSPMCGTIVVEGYGITLLSPEPHYYQNEVVGVSNTENFKWEFYTKVPTTQCAFDFTTGFEYESLPSHKILDPISENMYHVASFPQDVFSTYDEDGGSKSVYVRCTNADGNIGPEQKFVLEFDPTSPEILDAYAQPDQVFEGKITELFVETDDKTLCRYSDDSLGQGSVEYETMEYGFPGNEDNVLEVIHNDVFTIPNVNDDGKKSYELLTQCRNGAGDPSDVATITFDVDYTALGFIIPSSLTPSGYIPAGDIVISLSTSKSALCEYRANETFMVMDGSGSKDHSASLGQLSEGKYSYLIRCSMGDHTTEANIEFTIDTTAPSITKVTDGNYTCGSDSLNVMVYTQEENATTYYYEVYKEGEVTEFIPSTNPTSGPGSVKAFSSNSSTTSTSSIPSGTLVFNETTTTSSPLEVPVSSLEEGFTYTIRVQVGDAAGNWGEFKESDGVGVVAKNFSACALDKDAPDVIVTVNDSSCTQASAELYCEDETGCDEVLFGQSAASITCDANKTYTGQKILFEKTGYVCYTASDTLGNNDSGSKKVTFDDADADGVADSCDVCSGTAPGELVDNQGCGSEEAPDVDEDQPSSDTDGDGLPDNWEKQFDAFGCDLSYLAKDSDQNGVMDRDEDYDADGLTNYEEYTGLSDPCLADTPSDDSDVEVTSSEENNQEYPTTSQKEEGNTLALIFLIAGLLLIVGGAGYLTYFYLYSPKSRQGSKGNAPPSQPSPRQINPTEQPTQQGGLIDTWKQKIASLKRSHAAKVKERQRAKVFSQFNQGAQEIPHVNEALSRRAPHLTKLHDLAHKYVEHKENIKPGLQKHEKGIFNKLENIAKKTKNKDIKDVVSKGEAKDIFSQLRGISKKRKNGET